MGNKKEKARARYKLRSFIKSKRIKRPAKCSKCGATDREIHGHHEDYNKPLDVIWLCKHCHMKLHDQGHYIIKTRFKPGFDPRRDKFSIGFDQRRHNSAKLTREKVKTIRKLYKTGLYTHKQLGNAYSISLNAIGCLLRNKTWRLAEPALKLGG